MSIRNGAALVLALVLSACVSSAENPLGDRFEVFSAESRGNSRLIVRAQLAELPGETAWEAVERLNRRWLRSQRGASFTPDRGVVYNYPKVVVDGISRNELEELRRISTESIENMRFISAADATTKYGTGFMGGAIEVTTRGLGRR